MSVPLATYLGRITPWQSNNPRFTATVSGSLAPITTAAAVIASLPAAFDLDTAVGAQLDIVGEWVGRARTVLLPIVGAYFSWDVEGLGWDQGAWRGPYADEVAIAALDDETYRRLLYANILAKRWDGTVPGAQAAFDAFFVDPATLVFVQDNARTPYPVAFFAWDEEGRGWGEANWYDPAGPAANLGAVDVSMTIGVAGKIPPPVYLGLLAQNAIPIKPGGVKTTYLVTSVDETPLFGWGVENEFVAGWGAGAWGVSPDYLLRA